MPEKELKMNEEMAVLLAKEGNRQAFRTLYEQHREVVFRLAFRYLHTTQDAEDVMQETFIKAFKGIDTFDFFRSSGFSAWINRICIHTAIEHLRKRKRRRDDSMVGLSDLYADPPAMGPSPEKSAVVNQTVQRLKQAALVLSPKQRIIFDLRHSRHLDIKEIAEQLQCSESTVKKQLFRAKLKLRKQLQPIWGEP